MSDKDELIIKLADALVQSRPWRETGKGLDFHFECIHCGMLLNPLVKDLAETHEPECIWVAAHVLYAARLELGTLPLEYE